MAHHFLSLIRYTEDAGPDMVEATTVAAQQLLGPSPELRALNIGPPTAVRNYDGAIDLVIDASFNDAEAFERFRGAATTREFSEKWLRPHAEVIHVSYDDKAQVERNKDNFRRFQEEVIVGGDMSLLPELMAPQMRVVRAANDTLMRWEGRVVPEERLWKHDQFINGYRAAVGTVRDHRRIIEHIHGEGDVVWARWTIEQRHDDDRHGIPATGRLVRTGEVGMVRFDDAGRMVEGWFMTDPFEFFEQVDATVSVSPRGE
ncbi:ester cyclase [Streptomyces sp. NPDC096311]|uniref:ester cyclase n=1 Tax=Streptomyces sp. NPDC096311 TaxID=3366083 RepID=UPI003802CEA2